MKQRFETFVMAIASISRSLQKLKSAEMADLGLKGNHVMCLYQLQQNDQGLTATQLSEFCEEDKAAISRTVADLREQGLVSILEDGSKRYGRRIRLTDRGRQVSEVMDEKIISAVKAATQGYSDQEREVFIRVLLLVDENLQAACVEEENK